MTYAEVILPLPIGPTFTYSVPEDMEADLCPGSRVLVQFGRKKYYTGLVEYLHSEAPKGYAVKPLMALLDPEPAIRYPQLKLWKWIAEYYLCSVGEVYKAAVPTGLKPESETYIAFNEEFEADEGVRLSNHEQMVADYIEEKKRARIADMEKDMGIRNPARIVSRLLELGIVCVDERVVERYRPKNETFVELTVEREDNESLHSFFDLVGRSRQQEKALLTLLELSGWLRHDREPAAVTRAQLQKEAGVTPGIVKALADKGIVRIVKRSVNRFNGSASGHTELSPLSEAQQKALTEIKQSFRDNRVTLLHGLTGSGKTEVYSHLISEVLNAGDQVLFLVPEISLTTQLTDRLRRMFGDRLLVYHSKFSDNERTDIWNRLLHGREPLVVLGVRSSVFLPFSHLGLVIVDEEHEASYKQYDPAPRYNARDAAIMLATMHGAPVVLGSATPSIETYYKATTGKYGLVQLSERFDGAVLPDVEIVDMREQRRKKANRGILSQPLHLALRKTLDDGKQAIVFQNRRGFAPVVICNQCGWTPKCRNCDVSLVYHKNTELLRCHYCGYSMPLPRLCPACGQNSVQTFGYGTERISEELHQVFDGHRISRMDLDTTRNKDAYQEIIEEFAAHDTDILVGTQMVSKGLDFANVNVVGVVNADTLLNFPDFRSNERAFNMLEQVAGRAGRRKEKGHVYIQTSRPDDDVLKFVQNHDYAGFYASELAEREKFGYPPFTRVINIFIKNKDDRTASGAAVVLTKRLREIFGARVLGPEKPFVSRVQLWYLQQIMLKVEAGASMKKVKNLLLEAFASVARDPNMRTSMVYYDVDPV